MDEELYEKMQEIKEKLQDIFGDDAIIHGFSGKSIGDMINEVNEFMNTPILTIKCSRIGTNIEVNKCNYDEVRHAVTEAIANMLELFPKDWRNDILFESIQLISDEHDKGGLFEHENEEE